MQSHVKDFVLFSKDSGKALMFQRREVGGRKKSEVEGSDVIYLVF